MHAIVYDHQTFVTQEFGGISRYFCELASRIHAIDGFSARIIAPLHQNAYLPSCDVPKTAYRLNNRFRGRGRLCQAVSGALTPALIGVSEPSLIHRTYYTPYRHPTDVPMVLSVFDMIHELFPESFHPDDPTSRWKAASVAAADHVLCISHSTADDLKRLLGVPAEKITVTYLACSNIFEQSVENNQMESIIRPYILYVGHRGGYKNFAAALEAYASSHTVRNEFDFLVFGGPEFSPEEFDFIRSLSLRPNSITHLVGDDSDLARAYRHARAFVYPSKYEGFGIPPLEAMGAGCVVACSNTSSIPEVVGNAAVSFNPNDIDDIRRALETACFDEGERKRLKEAGMRRAREFSWERCASETAAAYRQMISE